MASTDMQRLVVALEARTKAFENALNKANGVANSRARAIETRFAKMNKVIGSRMAGIGKGWIAGIVAGLGGRELAQLSDAATKIDNALKIAGLSGEELEKVYGKLRDSAVANAAPLEALVELYGRAALVQKELGINSEELVGFTDKVALALRVSGKTAQESSGALLQLSQALGSGVVRAEEFNSILEGAPTIAQAAAAGLKEAGGSVARLRQLVVDGKISSEAFFRAFEAGAPILEEKVAGATYTINQSMGNLRTALIDAAREFNNSTGAGERFATGVNNIAKAISDFDVSGFIRKIQEAGGALDRFMTDFGNSPFFERLAESLTGLEVEVGKPIDLNTVEAEQDVSDLDRQIKLLQERIALDTELELDTTEAKARLDELLGAAVALRSTLTGSRGYQPGTPGDPNALAQKPTLGTTKVKPVSTSDFAPPSGTKSGSGKARKSEWQRETEQIKERTAALQAETAAMAGLNPLLNDYGFALEKARAVAELENAALAAKVDLTPKVKASIDALATSYANAVVDAEVLAERQDRVRESAQAMADLGKDVFGGFISDLRNGTSAAEALQGALDKVLDKVLEISLNSIFGGGLGDGGNPLGIIGSLLGLKDGGAVRMASGGRVNGPGTGRSDSVPAMLSNGEYVVNAAAASRNAGLLEAINSGSIARMANGGPIGAIPRQAASAPQEIVITLVGEEGEMFTPRVQQISGQTAGVVVRESRPALAKDAVSAVQSASRNRPGIFR